MASDQLRDRQAGALTPVGGSPRLPESLSPVMLLAVLGQFAQQGLRAALAPLDLSIRQTRVLELLSVNGVVGQSDLLKHLQVDPSVMVGVLNPLEEKGLIRRDRDPSNRRQHVITLTPAGQTYLGRTRAASSAAQTELLGVLPGTQREALCAALLRLYQAHHGDIACPTSDRSADAADTRSLE